MISSTLTSASRTDIVVLPLQDILPYMMLAVAGTIIAGMGTAINGHYWLWMIVPPALTAIGGGLFRTITTDTSYAKLAGFMVIIGFGTGCTIQVAQIAVQAEWHSTPEKIPQATAVVSFAQLLGGVVGIAVCQVLLFNGLGRELAPLGLPADVLLYVKSSVEAIKDLSPELKPLVIDAYVSALRDVYVLAVPAAAMSVVCALFVRNRNTKAIGMSAVAAA